MTLEEFYKQNSIAGFGIKELSNILNLQSEYKVVLSPPNGIVLKKNGETKILGCVANYFTNNDKHKKLKTQKSSNSITGTCHYIQKELGCSHLVSPGCCRTCFSACLSKLDKDVFKI